MGLGPTEQLGFSIQIPKYPSTVSLMVSISLHLPRPPPALVFQQTNPMEVIHTLLYNEHIEPDTYFIEKTLEGGSLHN
jgi:hypothetical protein